LDGYALTFLRVSGSLLHTGRLAGLPGLNVSMTEKIIHFFEARQEVVAVYLFGSRARGRARETSDIDLAVLVDPQAMRDVPELKRALMIGLSGMLRKEIHLVILNNAGEALSAQVFKHGKCLYNSKAGILTRFKTAQFSKIADFAYLRSIMEKGFTRKILEGEH
jgi:predicted nucleotidyltransferase